VRFSWARRRRIMMDKSTKEWLKRSFRLWLVCKIAATLFWMLFVGVPLSVLLVMVVAGEVARW